MNVTLKKTIWRDPLHFIACGFGSGLLPKAPGTFGSLLAIPLYLLFAKASLWTYIFIVAFGFAVGIWVCDVTGRDIGVADHPSIVWDEVIGMWIALFAVPFQWYWIGLAFLLFRFFDIFKLWPMRQIEKHLDNGLGVMLDDVVAGVYALLSVHGIIYLISFI